MKNINELYVGQIVVCIHQNCEEWNQPCESCVKSDDFCNSGECEEQIDPSGGICDHHEPHIKEVCVDSWCGKRQVLAGCFPGWRLREIEINDYKPSLKKIMGKRTIKLI